MCFQAHPDYVLSPSIEQYVYSIENTLNCHIRFLPNQSRESREVLIACPNGTQEWSSVYKSKVQSLHSLILGCGNVILLLLLGQGIPFRISCLVTPDVVSLNQIKQDDVEAADSQQNLVTAAVEWLVIIAINILCDDIARLDTHVVQRSTYSASADSVAVTGVPCDQNSVAIGIAQQARQ